MGKLVKLINCTVPLNTPIRIIKIDKSHSGFEFVDIARIKEIEREACAKIAENADFDTCFPQLSKDAREIVGLEIAKAIRERK